MIKIYDFFILTLWLTSVDSSEEYLLFAAISADFLLAAAVVVLFEFVSFLACGLRPLLLAPRRFTVVSSSTASEKSSLYCFFNDLISELWINLILIFYLLSFMTTCECLLKSSLHFFVKIHCRHITVIPIRVTLSQVL